MRRLQILVNAVNRAKTSENRKVSKAQEKLFAEYKKIFKKSKELTADLERLEVSRQFGQDENGIYSWARLTYSYPNEEYAREAFEEFVSDHGYHYEEEHQCLKNYQGESIVIVDNGDVYVGDESKSKLIINASEYKHNEIERNELIENWMQKNQFWPNVFRETRYGDVFLVNTQGVKK